MALVCHGSTVDDRGRPLTHPPFPSAASRNALPGLKRTVRFSGIATSSPVRGFLPGAEHRIELREITQHPRWQEQDGFDQGQHRAYADANQFQWN